MKSLIDQAERDRFILEHSKNISVIAPAGVGKTTSIVERIVRVARLPETEAIERLSRLVVVTYSVRAAQQMQQRTRVAVRQADVSPRVQRAFKQTFFGTIHSYCVRLLDRFGHYLGLPSPVGLLQDSDDLWQRFLLRGLGREFEPDANLRELFYFYPPEKLYGLGAALSPGDELTVGPVPAVDLRRVLNYQNSELHAATRKSIARAQDEALAWSKAWARGEHFRPLPACPASEKAAGFAVVWNESFAPLHQWLHDAAMAFGRSVANAYEHFRLAEAVMTYDDQVRLALRLLHHPEVQRELTQDQPSVLLDEAQDTDPRQFDVLWRVAGLGDDATQADDQSFSIVGDFQQAIYAPRSDLSIYRAVHDRLSTGPRGTSSRLQVTFRCDRAIIHFANTIFPSLLNDTAGQSAFETLVAREDAGPGQVVRWSCPNEPEQAVGKKINAAVRARHEAQFLARRMAELGPAGLGATDWSQVAILCPRNGWLADIRRELAGLGLPVQLHSAREERRDRISTAWLTSLVWVAAHPEDSFEIAGVLREIFGVSDSDMARFTARDGNRLRLDRAMPEENGPLESTLKNLREACAGAVSRPVHEAVQRLLEATDLRERLHAVGEEDAGVIDRELDDLLGRIAGRSAEGATLAKLAQELRLDLAQSHPEEEEIQNAIQLLTSYKAKGLEWETVIVPYVFRTIEYQAQPYPRVVLMEGGAEVVCRDKADFERRARPAHDRRERQQLQRLLYVVATRAKRSLVWVDDEELYLSLTKPTGWSSGELLGFLDEPNRTTWRALPEDIVSLDVAPEAEIVPVPILPPLPTPSPEDIRRAVAHSREFPHRITPHALAVHARDAEPEQGAEREDSQPPTVIDGPGIRYGTWWHEFIQTVPWSRPEAWAQKFDEAQTRSPRPERSRREWELFCRSELARWLGKPDRLVQMEIPFLWRENTGGVLEGIIDLAVYSESESAWRVIDWKTNRVGPEGSAALVQVYRGQINAYVRALREMFSLPVRGSLYLTQTGEWVDVGD